MVSSPINQRWHFCFACIDHVSTARAEPATDRRIHRRRRVARQDNALARMLTRWIANPSRTDERLCLAMQRLLQDRAAPGKRDDPAEIHHRAPTGHMVPDPW